MKAQIFRTYEEGYTSGRLFLFDEKGKIVFHCDTVELPWRDNKAKISCIPEGKYKVVPRTSPKFGKHFWVTDVKDRQFILFHFGNSRKNSEGCFIVGIRVVANGEYVELSKKTLSAFVAAAPNGFELEICQNDNLGVRDITPDIFELLKLLAPPLFGLVSSAFNGIAKNKKLAAIEQIMDEPTLTDAEKVVLIKHILKK